jgi:DNA-binding TFAR19-related protein (PDSD5 family)
MQDLSRDDYMDIEELQRMQQIDEMKKQLLGKILMKEAYERLGRVRLANPETAAQAELYILQVYQAGKLDGSISDSQMKDILRALSEKKEFKIKRE